MSMVVTQEEPKNRRRGVTLSVIVHITLLIIALLPLLTYPDPPPGQEGILVNLGLPDQGQGDENAAAAESEPAAAEPEPEEVTPPQEETAPKPEPVKEKEVLQTEDPEEIALKRKREQERKQQEETDRKAREEEARRKAAADEAKRKAAEEDARRKAEADKMKGTIGGLFGDGKGKGKTGTSGNQGDPNGDPNAEALEGISTGSGKTGGGLLGRGVVSSPKVVENSQKQGTVVVEVCVNADGDVTSAKFTQRGSNTSDGALVRAAVDNAKSWRFSKGSVDQQCGTITYNFKLQ